MFFTSDRAEVSGELCYSAVGVACYALGLKCRVPGPSDG